MMSLRCVCISQVHGAAAPADIGGMLRDADDSILLYLPGIAV